MVSSLHGSRRRLCLILLRSAARKITSGNKIAFKTPLPLPNRLSPKVVLPTPYQQSSLHLKKPCPILRIDPLKCQHEIRHGIPHRDQRGIPHHGLAYPKRSARRVIPHPSLHRLINPRTVRRMSQVSQSQFPKQKGPHATLHPDQAAILQRGLQQKQC